MPTLPATDRRAGPTDTCPTSQPDPTQHLRDYQYVSQYSSDSTTGITIYIAGSPGDPDAESVSVSMYDITNTLVFTQGAVRAGVGMYQITLSSEQTATPGYYSLVWSFDVASALQSVTTYLQVGAENPDYDALPGPMQDIVQITWARFMDMFDSPQGGPHLQVYFQSNFSMGRLSQLLNLALGLLNTMAQPYSTMSMNNFPYAQWGPLLEKALYIEVLKHLIRSYTEQPNVQGVTVSYTDRRDYVDRWSSVLNMEQSEFNDMLSVFKISQMGLGRPMVLVSGGAFGSFAPTRLPGNAAARPNLWSRFYL